MAYDSGRQRILLYGGYGPVGINQTRELSDFWAWDDHGWTRLEEFAQPGGLQMHAMAFDAARDRLVLFGGSINASQNNRTYEWDGTTWSLAASSGPSPRAGHVMAYDSARQRVVMFGGTLMGDTWEWNGVEWQLMSLFGVYDPPRYGFALAYDPAQHTSVLFGGEHSNMPSQGAGWSFEWDGEFWTQTSNFGPSNRYEHAMCYNTLRDRVVMFGGTNRGPVFRDTWEYNGNTKLWNQVAITGPSERSRPAMAYDDARHAVVLFGGSGFSGFLSDTWLRTSVPVIRPATASVQICPSGIVTFSVAASGSGPIAYQWQHEYPIGMWFDIDEGVNVNMATATGIAAPTLFLANLGPIAPGAYRCVVTNACGSATSNAATLTVCVADTDNGSRSGACDGGTGIEDLLYYLGVYDAGTGRADVDDGAGTGHPDGGVGIEDLLYYLGRYDAGC